MQPIGLRDSLSSDDPARPARQRLRGTEFGIGRAGVLLITITLTGCANFSQSLPFLRPEADRWHFTAPFDTSDVKTVAIFFKTQTFRRDLQLALTEAVAKEISMRTPYRVVGDPAKADSVVRGVITVADKNLIVEAPTNLPRQLNSQINVMVTWTHNPPTDIEKARLPTLISETDYFVPEVGETAMVSFNHVVQSLAKQIVDMMEQPWFLDEDLK
jgi:hypothetical protein